MKLLIQLIIFKPLIIKELNSLGFKFTALSIWFVESKYWLSSNKLAPLLFS